MNDIVGKKVHWNHYIDSKPTINLKGTVIAYAYDSGSFRLLVQDASWVLKVCQHSDVDVDTADAESVPVAKNLLGRPPKKDADK